MGFQQCDWGDCGDGVVVGVSLQIDLAVIDGFCGRLLDQEWWHWPFAWVVECFFGWLLGFVVQWLWLLGFV